MKLKPKPKVNDFVERCNMTRLFGTVKKVINDKCLISWNDGELPEETIEKTTSLALVERKVK